MMEKLVMPENVPVDRPGEVVLRNDTLQANVQVRPDVFFAVGAQAFEPPETYKSMNPEQVPQEPALKGSLWK